MRIYIQLAFSVLWLSATVALHAQNTISVPFSNGFVGIIGNNSQNADNVQNLSTLGLSSAFFIQNSSTTSFEIQGNDIAGAVRLISNSGQFLEVEGAIVWRVTSSGNALEILGFIPASTTPSVNLTTIGGNDYVLDASSNFGLRINSSTYTITDGTAISGNAATSGLLDALNSYLAEVVSNGPTGPVVTNDLTTSDLTPTLSGQVTLTAGETFAVLVGGVFYDVSTSPALSIIGTDWSLTLGTTTIGTYEVTGMITDGSGYTLSDVGVLTISGCTDLDADGICDSIDLCTDTSANNYDGSSSNSPCTYSSLPPVNISKQGCDGGADITVDMNALHTGTGTWTYSYTTDISGFATATLSGSTLTIDLTGTGTGTGTIQVLGSSDQSQTITIDVAVTESLYPYVTSFIVKCPSATSNTDGGWVIGFAGAYSSSVTVHYYDNVVSVFSNDSYLGSASSGFEQTALTHSAGGLLSMPQGTHWISGYTNVHGCFTAEPATGPIPAVIPSLRSAHVPFCED